MYKSLMCYLRDVRYKIWKDKPIPKGAFLALTVRSMASQKHNKSLNPGL